MHMINPHRFQALSLLLKVPKSRNNVLLKLKAQMFKMISNAKSSKGLAHFFHPIVEN